jgi:anti-sigma regulatory factor (Ser/Thr protein kinase)
MDTPAEGRQRTSGTSQRAAILGSVTVPGGPEHVSGTRAFVARTLAGLSGVDCDAATLLTSELVTNAIRHTDSGAPGGTVTVVVIGVPSGVLVEVVDDGSADTPVVKGNLFAAEGHGLFLVQQIAAQWGYLRDSAGTTVWFHLVAADVLDGPGAPHQPDARPGAIDGYLAAATAVAASTAASIPEQMPATSSSQVT